MIHRDRLRWPYARLLPVMLAGVLLLVACTDDEPSPAPTATVEATGATSAADLGAADVVTGTQFEASNGLFALLYPEGWLAEEHADGGGVTIGSSSEVLAADAGTPTASELAINITFLPAELFRLVEVDPDSPTQVVVELLAPADGSEPSAPELIDLEGGLAVTELRSTREAADGAVYVFDAAPGVFGVVSVTTAPQGFEPMSELVLAMLDSLQFNGTAEALIEVLDPPPSTPGVFG